jgi:hypothetical protein
LHTWRLLYEFDLAYGERQIAAGDTNTKISPVAAIGKSIQL